MQISLLSFIAASAVLAAGPVLAADGARLSSIEGSVQVARAGEVRAAQAGTLETGDRVVAGSGSAVVTYADGCVVQLNRNSMQTVGAASPCAGGQGLTRASDLATAQTWSNMSRAEIIGAVVVGGLVVTGAALSVSGDDDLPVSP